MFAVVRFILDDELGEKGGQVADIGWLAKQFWVLFIHHDFAEQAFLAAEIAADQRDIDARAVRDIAKADARSEEHTSELQSLMRISYAVFCLNKKQRQTQQPSTHSQTHNTYTHYYNHHIRQ